MPAKPKKWEIKLWGRCSSTCFLHDFNAYRGRGTGVDGANVEACGLGGNVVLQLCKSISSVITTRHLLITISVTFVWLRS